MNIYVFSHLEISLFMDRIIVFSAPSGAGKTSIIQQLLKNKSQLEFSISATSRPPREGERNGVDYYFLTTEEFQKRIAQDDFLEWEEVYGGNLYGTLKSEIKRIKEKGKVTLFDVDVQGGLNIKKKYPNALLIFVIPPSLEVLKERLLKRSTESAESLAYRVAKAESELLHAKEYDYILLNDDLEEAIEEVQAIINNYVNHSIIPSTFRYF